MADLYQIIADAARRHNVPYEALLAVAQLESSMRPDARNRNSSASGLFQFTSGTARDYGLTGSRRNDPAAQADAAARMMAQNTSSLQRTLGRPPNAGELYLAHQQGLGGARALLSNPNRPAIDALTAAYGGNRQRAQQALLNNGGAMNMTAGQFANRWVDRGVQTAQRVPPRNVGPNTAVASALSVRQPGTAPTPANQSQDMRLMRNPVMSSSAARGSSAPTPAAMSNDMRLMRNPVMSSTAARPSLMQQVTPTLNPNGSVTMPGPMGDWATYNPITGQFENRVNTGPAALASQSPGLAQRRSAAPPSTIGQPSHATAQRSRPAPVQRASLPPLAPPSPNPTSRPAPMPTLQSAALADRRADNAFNRSFTTPGQVSYDPGLRTALDDYARTMAAGQPAYRPQTVGGPNADRLVPNVQIGNPAPAMVGINHPRGAAARAALIGTGGPSGPIVPVRPAPTPRAVPAQIALQRDPRMAGAIPAPMAAPGMALMAPAPIPVAPVPIPMSYSQSTASQSYHPHSSHSFFSGRDDYDPYGGGGRRY